MIACIKRIPVRFYREASGNEPVRLWLKSLDPESRKIIGKDLKKVQMYWPTGMPLVRPLGKALWEIRITLKYRIARIIFVLDDGQIVLLHGFIKKTEKTPLKDLGLATKRHNKDKEVHYG